MYLPSLSVGESTCIKRVANLSFLLLDAQIPLNMEFWEGDGRRLFTVNLWSELPFVLAFFSLANGNPNYGFLVFNLSFQSRIANFIRVIAL
uniref:Uncharacterized protein n=1 Tax=Brassica oleracea var. oleracea TaxID=109376 RepID=A0A0D3C048_BRAOL